MMKRVIRIKGTLPNTNERTSPLQRGWHIDLSDLSTGESIHAVQHATVELDANGVTTAVLTFLDRVQDGDEVRFIERREEVYAVLG